MNSNDIRKAVELLDELELNRRQIEQIAAARQAFIRLYDEADGATHAAIELFDAEGVAIGGIVDLDAEIVLAVREAIRDRIALKSNAIFIELTCMGVTVASGEAALA